MTDPTPRFSACTIYRIPSGLVVGHSVQDSKPPDGPVPMSFGGEDERWTAELCRWYAAALNAHHELHGRQEVIHDERRPCPHCGATDSFIGHELDENEVWVECRGCEARGPRAVIPPVATSMWNKRKGNTP